MFGKHGIALSLLLLSCGASLAQLSPEEEQVVRDGKARITANLKDPLSVQFRNLFIAGKGAPMPILCGELNAKNSYGAYVGFARFFSASSSINVIEERGRYFHYDLWCNERDKIKEVPN